MHNVNAHLWERYHLEPRSHDERTYGVQKDEAIRRCRFSYGALKDAGFYARCSATYNLSEGNARALLEGSLRDVEATVPRALGQPAPDW